MYVCVKFSEIEVKRERIVRPGIEKKKKMSMYRIEPLIFPPLFFSFKKKVIIEALMDEFQFRGARKSGLTVRTFYFFARHPVQLATVKNATCVKHEKIFTSILPR